MARFPIGINRPMNSRPGRPIDPEEEPQTQTPEDEEIGLVIPEATLPIDGSPQVRINAPATSPAGGRPAGDRSPEGTGNNPPPRQIAISEARPIDGSGSNETNPDWGAAGSPLLRLADANFADGLGEMVDLPNAREISNSIAQQEGEVPNSFGLSDMFWAWGQFIDHDIDLTGDGESTYAPIAVPQGDPWFDPEGTGDAVIHFSRTVPVDGTGETTPREYSNQITAFIDASMVYGSDADTAQSLRTDGGKLRLDENGFLPTDDDGNVLAGDVRAGENVALTSLQTLFAREHNRWVDRLSEIDPGLSDDELYNAARQRVEAEIQAITFNEFLPLLVGEDAITEYEGYDPTVNPGISLEFATAAFRFGHSLLSSEIQRLDEDGSVSEAGNLSLRDAFFAPDEITENGGIASILRGLGDGTAQELDTQVVEDVRSFLFGEPGSGGLDLAALNIQRGRDLGVASYNDLREALGLDRAGSFDDITSDADLAARLEALYGSVDDVDAWIGGLAEDAHGEGVLGELFSVIIVDQFLRLRDGDPFWSEGSEFSDRELDKLWSTTLADVIERNSEVDAIQDNVLLAYDRIGGSGQDDQIAGSDGRDFVLGFDGDDELSGGAGNDQLEGGAGSDVLMGDAGNDILYGGGGDDRLNGGAGDDTLSGGRGADTFVFAGAFGNDVITDFRLGRGSGDTILIDTGDFGTISDLLAAAFEDGGNTVIDFGTEGSITLEGVDLAMLSQNDFSLV